MAREGEEDTKKKSRNVKGLDPKIRIKKVGRGRHRKCNVKGRMQVFTKGKPTYAIFYKMKAHLPYLPFAFTFPSDSMIRKSAYSGASGFKIFQKG
jgi:hypothetical protein